ncbi:MAG: FkbM family methyltransferase [Crocinitomicaceae bacterium]|jgi:FkbM family methyltransferase|nr:FkbM family methyltransferase [Crocinitomicaceae bacterium]
MKVKYCNPYLIKENLLIKIYKYCGKKPSNKLSSYWSYLVLIIFRRFAFAFVARGIKLPTTAYYAEKKFIARSTNSQFHSIYFEDYNQVYEPDVFAVIELFLPQDGVFIDVGSNWGHHSFIAALEKNAKVYSFEPNHSVFTDLIGIARSLGCETRVRGFNVGCGASEGQFELTQLGFESGVGSLSQDFLKNRQDAIRWPERLINRITFKRDIKNAVVVRKLDDLIDPNVKVDVIKIDVEGAELECLKGATSILSRSRPKILFELHTDADGSIGSFATFFETLNYKLYIVEPNVEKDECAFRELTTLTPFKQYNILASANPL